MTKNTWNKLQSAKKYKPFTTTKRWKQPKKENFTPKCTKYSP